jgi:arsenate reductase (glutaredoxin)
MPIRMYGITNCDTVKKARAFLAQRGLAFDFIDYKKQGVPADLLNEWVAALGWERLLNRKGNTWRGLDEAGQAAATDAAGATRLMLAHPSVIKRPVVVWADGRATVGFDPAAWASGV